MIWQSCVLHVSYWAGGSCWGSNWTRFVPNDKNTLDFLINFGSARPYIPSDFFSMSGFQSRGKQEMSVGPKLDKIGPPNWTNLWHFKVSSVYVDRRTKTYRKVILKDPRFGCNFTQFEANSFIPIVNVHNIWAVDDMVNSPHDFTSNYPAFVSFHTISFF